VHLEDSVLLLGLARDRLHREHGPRLVLHMHHADQDRLRRDRLNHGARVQATLRVDGDPSHPQALLLEGAEDLGHRRVLDRAGHHVVAAPAQRRHGPADRQVVGLGAAAGEYDLARAGPQSLGHLLAGLLERSRGLGAQSVQAARVAVERIEAGQHGLAHLGQRARGGCVVEVERIHGQKARPP
jgi:hypothetical protein